MEIDVLYKKFLECNGRLSIDSRTIIPGSMFIAVKGERFDGNDYVDEVLSKKASYAIIDDPKAQRDERTLLVSDSLETLQMLATRHRRSFDIPVIAITGSNGKTTTKELLTAVLNRKYRVHATKGNYNNHIGVPLTLLSAGKSSTDIMIIEMGANHIGEIAELCKIAEPNYGLITNIGKAHLEGFGSLEGVVEAKTELYKYIGVQSGFLFYDSSDKLLFSKLPNGVKTIPYIQETRFRETDLMLEVGYGSTKGYKPTKLTGNYNRPNISAAITIGNHFSVSDHEILTAICDYAPNNNRSQVKKFGDVTLILDAYNANPSSMRKSIESLAQNTSEQAKVLLLGDMKELGKDSVLLHKDILQFIQKYNWKKVILVGKDFAQADDQNVFLHFENIEALSRSKSQILTMLRNSICLVKASRSVKLEQVVTLFE